VWWSESCPDRGRSGLTKCVCVCVTFPLLSLDPHTHTHTHTCTHAPCLTSTERHVGVIAVFALRLQPLLHQLSVCVCVCVCVCVFARTLTFARRHLVSVTIVTTQRCPHSRFEQTPASSVLFSLQLSESLCRCSYYMFSALVDMNVCITNIFSSDWSLVDLPACSFLT